MKKLTFLFIATFIMALAFFSSYFLIQKVYGAVAVYIDNDINMMGYRIQSLKNPRDAVIAKDDAISLDYVLLLDRICFQYDTDHRAAEWGLGRFCVANWCQINDFEWCTETFEPSGYGCFTAETPILMADGKYKNIADIQPGEYVLTRESENSAKLVKAKVLDTYEHWDNRHLIINNYLEVTPNHRMFVNGEWKTAEEIKLGDKLFNKDNQEVVVESMEKRIKEKEFKVYNLEIEKYQTYFARGFYVHNRKPEEGPPFPR